MLQDDCFSSWSWPSRDLRSGLSGTNSCQARPARSILQWTD